MYIEYQTITCKDEMSSCNKDYCGRGYVWNYGALAGRALDDICRRTCNKCTGIFVLISLYNIKI